MTTLTKFNNTISQFIENLSEVVHNQFPEWSSHLNMAKERFDMLRKVNPRVIMEAYLIYVYPYKERIMNRDEKYFLEHDYAKEISESGIEQADLVDVLHIKRIWVDFENEQIKDTIWKYFQVLVLLSERYIVERGIDVTKLEKPTF